MDASAAATAAREDILELAPKNENNFPQMQQQHNDDKLAQDNNSPQDAALSNQEESSQQVAKGPKTYSVDEQLESFEKFHVQVDKWLLLNKKWKELGTNMTKVMANEHVAKLLNKHKIAQPQPATPPPRRVEPARPQIERTRVHRSRDNVSRVFKSFYKSSQWKRSVADCFDMLFVSLIILAAITTYSLVLNGDMTVYHQIVSPGLLPLTNARIWFKVILLVAFVVHEFVASLFMGRTLGKVFFNFRIVHCYKVAHTNENYIWVTPGSPPSIGQLLVRSLLKSIGFLFFPLFHWTAMHRHRTFYDIISGTLVVKDIP